MGTIMYTLGCAFTSGALQYHARYKQGERGTEIESILVDLPFPSNGNSSNLGCTSLIRAAGLLSDEDGRGMAGSAACDSPLDTLSP